MICFNHLVGTVNFVANINVMKFDAKICKDIFEIIQESGYKECDSNSFENIAQDVLAYHLELLINGGIINARKTSHKDIVFPYYFNMELTLEGNEFASHLTNKTVFNKLKTKLQNIGGAASLSIIKELSKELFRATFLN